MVIDVVMPKMGESITEGTILEWYKKIGDEIEQDETLLEIGTDKVDSEIPSPSSGVITMIMAEPNDVVDVGEVIARIETDSESVNLEKISKLSTNEKLIEKPEGVVKEKDVELLTPYGFNWNPLMSKAEEFVASGIVGKIQHVDTSFSSSLIDLFQGVPLSESNEHTFKPLASTWSDPSKAGGYGWGQLSHMFAGVYKVTKLSPLTELGYMNLRNNFEEKI